MAQLVEHFIRNERVRGSSPRVGSYCFWGFEQYMFKTLLFYPYEFIFIRLINIEQMLLKTL